MRNKYLLLGAASALMLAACSEDVKGPGMDPAQPAENALNLTSLSSASQAGRVSFPGETRGQKADRLQLVAKIAPVSTAADKKWSATGVAISGNTAYVSWHSDHQAKVEATAWGGALDALNIDELAKLNGAINPQNVILSTQTSDRVKFNNVIADGNNLYFPLTCHTNGAVVGRLAVGASAMDTIGIPGSSANAILVDGNKLYAATGYAGGLYSMPTDFTEDTKFTEEVAMNASFGGKYIANGNVLRTDETNAYLLPIAGGSEVKLDVPLVSALKYAESYDPVTGEWSDAGETKAAYYGKHTMDYAGGFTYVGAGKNGLRVYSATSNGTAVWYNNTNTTAVTVATVDGNEYVFAATGAGLRVYQPYDSEAKNLPLFAYEVKDYDSTGKPADAENSNSPETGTRAHSSNFVAVDTVNGLIFVACGQSGVYVFRLDTTVAPETATTGFIIPGGGGTEEIDKDVESVKIKVPELPEGYDKWEDEEGNPYNPGDEYEFKPGETIELTPVKTVVQTYTLKFMCFTYDNTDGEGNELTGISDLPETMEQTTNSFVIPATVPKWGERTFHGWSTTPANYDYKNPELKAGDTFVIPEGKTEYTLYGMWSSTISGGTTTEPEQDPEPVTPPVVGGEDLEGDE